MDRRIVAIGGAVIKTARQELKEVIKLGGVDMLIHNGGSIFHDFQLATEKLKSHSYSISELLDSFECNKPASYKVLNWIKGGSSPSDSVTDLCNRKDIPVLMFTGLACDFWQLFIEDWGVIASRAQKDFEFLVDRFSKKFHYLCMGSAVIHPEVFLKAVAMAKPDYIKADVVDFLDMYRPKSRVAVYGSYYKMTHKEFLVEWISSLQEGIK